MPMCIGLSIHPLSFCPAFPYFIHPFLTLPLHHYNRDPQLSYPGNSFLRKNKNALQFESLHTHRQESGKHVIGSTITLSEYLQILLCIVSGSFSGIISPLFTYSTLPATKVHENKALLKNEFSLSFWFLFHYRGVTGTQSIRQSEWR